MEKGFRKAQQAQPHPSHIRDQRTNHPKKGSTIAADPIRNLDDIEAIKQLLYSKPRDYLLFVMGINNGLRVGDMLKLKAGLFRNVREGDKIPLREEKTGKHQEVVINKPIKEALERYFAHCKPDDEQFLFKSQRGEGPICISAVNLRIKNWCRAINLDGNYGSHTLRKTFGYILRQKYGVSWEILSMRLNHDSPSVTRRYLGIEDDEVNDVLMKCTI
jgi:integrase